MAIAEISKLNLAAMSYDREGVLNALQRTQAAEIKLHSQTEYAVPSEADTEQLRARLSQAESALEALLCAAKSYYKQTKTETTAFDDVEITYSEFMSARDNAAECDSLIGEINTLRDDETRLKAELSKLSRTMSAARIYSEYSHSLRVENTPHTIARLGTIPASAKELFMSSLGDSGLCVCSVLGGDTQNVLVLIAAHKSEAERAQAAMQISGFTDCPFKEECTGEELYSSLKSREEELTEELKANSEKWAALSEHIRPLKIHCDYLAFELEKAEHESDFRTTDSTFLLEAYVPKEAEEEVAKALGGVSEAIYFEFSEPSADEAPPTILKNNKVVKNFEAITNMYSPPSSRELDPNTVMAFFYSVFLGFIMADIGYGLLMIAGGLFIYFKIRRDGMIKRLGGVFAAGGVFTVIWGVLFNSFFGFALLPFKVMPDLQGAAMSWSLAGIKVPALLIISMLIGVIQLGAGYVCLAVQRWRRGEVWDGIFDGVVWALFSVGVELAIVGFVEEFNLPVLKAVGGITAGASLLVAILTAGRKEKLLGKFTKGFGSAYGVINYASDILSYARLYGLMLAGAVIADIISSNSVSLISSGNVAFIILGVLIMLIGHVFNLAIGLLGAYIHDARLQYVEFYGRFFEGEGRLFTPLGSKHNHIYIS